MMKSRVSKASSLLDAFAGGRADYVMVDVEGFDDSVVYSLDLGRHRPKLIAFESRSCSVRPEALYDVVEFCSMRGYKAVGPVKANHVCIRDDRSAKPVAPAGASQGAEEAALPGAAGDFSGTAARGPAPRARHGPRAADKKWECGGMVPHPNCGGGLPGRTGPGSILI